MLWKTVISARIAGGCGEMTWIHEKESEKLERRNVSHMVVMPFSFWERVQELQEQGT